MRRLIKYNLTILQKMWIAQKAGERPLPLDNLIFYHGYHLLYPKEAERNNCTETDCIICKGEKNG